MIEKINLKQTFDRLLAFYEGRMKNGIMANISFPSSDSEKAKEKQKNQTARVCECLALEDPGFHIREIKKATAYWRDSLNDVIPTAYPTGSRSRTAPQAFNYSLKTGRRP